VTDAAVRLDEIHSLVDFEALAALAMPAPAHGYVAGGAWGEETLADNEAAWRRYRLRPRVLVDVSRIDPSTDAFGRPSAMPVAIAPMAVHGVAHPDAELAVGRAAAVAGIPFALSTMSTCSIEDVAAAAPAATRWFQLYAQADPGRTRSLVERAAAAGYRTLLVTVDLPVLGYRERDLRSGFRLDVALGNFPEPTGPTHADHGAGIEEAINDDLFSSLTWSDLAAIRSWSSMPLVLKGILTPEDARIALDHGVDGIVVSNHGARQLDRTLAPVDALADVVEAVDGRTEVWVDGGVRRGLDIAIALALGAHGVLIGRPILWALAAGGQAGVERALAIVRAQLLVTLALLGTATPADITRSHVQRARPADDDPSPR
jgi:4-hydroxymandelate oxidase